LSFFEDAGSAMLAPKQAPRTLVMPLTVSHVAQVLFLFGSEVQIRAGMPFVSVLPL
jgi:hypothetical protein